MPNSEGNTRKKVAKKKATKKAASDRDIEETPWRVSWDTRWAEWERQFSVASKKYQPILDVTYKVLKILFWCMCLPLVILLLVFAFFLPFKDVGGIRH